MTVGLRYSTLDLNIINVIIQIIIGYLIADFITALFHWFEDNYLEFNTSSSIINDIAFHNTMHHFYPRMIVMNSFFDNIRTSLILAFIIILFIYLINKQIIIKYYIFFITLFIVSTLANYIHRLAHQRDCENNSFVKFMQKYGLFISHKEHSHHHSINPEMKYGVINNYTNYIYDGIGIWRILEKIVYFFTGIKPCIKPTTEYFYSYYDDTLLNLINSKCPRRLTDKEQKIYFKKLKDIYIINNKYQKKCYNS